VTKGGKPSPLFPARTVLVGVGTAFESTVGLSPEWMIALIATIFAVAWGLPPYLLGWERRRPVPDGGG